jgi:hypothetical protein
MGRGSSGQRSTRADFAMQNSLHLQGIQFILLFVVVM